MSQLQLDTVRTYLRHLHAGNTAGLISTFEDEGVVYSPSMLTPTTARASSRRCRVSAA